MFVVCLFVCLFQPKVKLVRKAASDASPPAKKEKDKDKERDKEKEGKTATSKKVACHEYYSLLLRQRKGPLIFHEGVGAGWIWVHHLKIAGHPLIFPTFFFSHAPYSGHFFG